jgi:hypothetical protein
MAEPRVSEPKPDPGGLWSVRLVKRDRRLCGKIHVYKRRRLNIYFTPRQTDEFFFTDQAWGVDAGIVQSLRAYGVTYIMLLIEDGTKMLAPIGLFGIAGEASGVMRKKDKNGMVQFRVPESLFSIRRPPKDESEEALLARMHIKGRGR